MLLFDGAAGLLLLALWLFCLVDVIVSDDHACRNLPKMVWFVVVLILPDVGSLLWLILGRPQGARLPGAAGGSGFGRYRAERQRFGTATNPVPNPDDDEAFLQQVRIRAEQQRQRARDQQRDQQRDDGNATDDPAPGRE